MNYSKQKFSIVGMACAIFFGMAGRITADPEMALMTPSALSAQQNHKDSSPDAIVQRLITAMKQDGVFNDVLDSHQQQQLLEVLYRVIERAPRDDSGSCDSNGCGTAFAGPCGTSASADLETIRQTLCCLKNAIGTPCGSCCVGDACADLQTLFGFLGCICSKIDAIGSFSDNFTSELDVIESKLDACCAQLTSKINVVESVVDSVDSKLDAVISTVDVIDSTIDVINSKLDTCCTQLNSKVDAIDSAVDGIDSKLDTCCTQLNSKVDVIDSAVDGIDSKLDTCCTQLNSKVDVIDSTVDGIDSKLDILLQPCVSTCFCGLAATDFAFVTNFTEITSTRQILSLDWSFDNKYVVVGYANQLPLTVETRLEVFRYNNGTLTSVATYADADAADVVSVQFSPVNYQIIAGRPSVNVPVAIHTFIFDPSLAPGLRLQQQGNNTTGLSLVVSAAWHPNGRYILFGQNNSTVNLASVDQLTGDITLINQLLSALPVNRQALEWNAANALFAAASIPTGSSNLSILQLDDANNPAVITVATAIMAFAAGSNVDATASVSWDPSGLFLGAGSYAAIIDDHVKVFAFDPIGLTLTEVASVPLADENQGILTMDFDPIHGDILSYGTDASSGDSFLVNYCFKSLPQTLSFIDSLDSGAGTPINAVRWSPNEKNIATGGSNNVPEAVLDIYVFDRPLCIETVLRLLCMEDSKFDVLDSKFDACCQQLNSKIDFCCQQLNSKLDLLLNPPI